MLINFKEVYFTYSPKTPYEYEALKDINLTIKEGSFTFIVGKTGCGKSTLIQQMNGLLVPSSGEVTAGDYVVSSDKKRRTKKLSNLRKEVGIVFQFSENQLFEDTVEKDVAFGPMNFGVKREEALEIAHKCIDSVGLNESYYQRSPFDLSGGNRRRVAIAGILALQPKVLILDEPTAGLDPRGSEEIMSLIQKMNKEGITIVLVSHDMNLVLRYATDVIVMNDGKIVKEATPDELFLENDEQYSLETPLIAKVVKAFHDKGVNLNTTNIRDIESLANEIARLKK